MGAGVGRQKMGGENGLIISWWDGRIRLTFATMIWGSVIVLSSRHDGGRIHESFELPVLVPLLAPRTPRDAKQGY